MVAQNANCLRNCLSKLYRSAANKLLEGNFSDYERKLQRVAFGEVVAFIEETLLTGNEEIPTFKLSDLFKKIVCSRCSFGKSVGNKRFQNRLFFQFEDMSAYNDKKEVILVFNHDVGEIISVAAEAS